jgi:hypothetical protein
MRLPRWIPLLFLLALLAGACGDTNIRFPGPDENSSGDGGVDSDLAPNPDGEEWFGDFLFDGGCVSDCELFDLDLPTE